MMTEKEQDDLLTSMDTIDLAVLNREACGNLNKQEKLKVPASHQAAPQWY